MALAVYSFGGIEAPEEVHGDSLDPPVPESQTTR